MEDKTTVFRDFFVEILQQQMKFISFSSELHTQTLLQLSSYFENKQNAKPTDPHPFRKEKLSLYDYYALTRFDDVLISYKGPITPVILSEISKDIRNKFADTPKVSKKIFSVFMELAQNILYYSSEKINFGGRHDSVGTILVSRNEGYHVFSCGNLVRIEDVERLLESCKTINSLNRDELREYKRVNRNAPQQEYSKGAGIGLIQVALTSGNPLEVEVREVDEQYSFFSISVKINS